jgi:hypothetical protein
MKPISATEVLRNRGFTPSNMHADQRYQNNSVASISVPAVSRDRVNSVKRKASSDINTKAGKKLYQGGPPSIDCQKLEKMDKKIKVMRGICGKLNEDATKVKLDIGLENIIRSFCEFVDVSASLHSDFLTLCRVEIPEPDSDTGVFSDNDIPVPVGASQKTPVDEEESQTWSQVATRRPAKQPAKKPAPAPVILPRFSAATQKLNQNQDPKLLAFEDAVKQSERSTLVFNLNLGSTKTLNQKAILTKATRALTEAAAEVEGNKGKPPSKEAVAALDDVISVIEDVTLFGKVTKPYENKKNSTDPRNRTFFTMPIRYEFKDKDTRVEAETILRDTCKVDCTTPYPTILRHCIRQVIEHVRNDFPKDYVKVTVDAKNVSLRLSRKGHDGWYTYDDPIELPREVLDIHSRTVPANLMVRNLPNRRVSTSRVDIDMVGEEEGGGGWAG